MHRYSDNDAAREPGLRLLCQELPAGRVKIHNELYMVYKDVNEVV